ncbi:MAG: FHA domain-containing protein, partial [Planctomycetota bacterium]
MACIVITDGPATGQRFALGDHRLVMIGRDDQCTFQILDERISRRHLQIRAGDGDGRHYAVDAGSANGVYVNGTRIGRDVRLEDGDQVTIGGTTIVYSDVDDPDAAHIADVVRKRGQRLR